MTPAQRGGRPAVLSRARIVAAAIAVLDAEGLEALTMRKLGSELGVAAMSVYRYLPNRDAVLAAVVDELVTGVESTVAPGEPWPEALAGFAAGYRRMLLAHPRAVPLLATHPVDVDAGLVLLGPVLERFAAAGVDQQDALMAVQSVVVYVLGHALAQVGTPSGAAPVPEPPPGAADYYDQWFAAGLRAMVGGFAQHLGGAL